MMNEQQAALLTASKGAGTGHHFFRFWMPYVFERVALPRFKHAFIPLNRNYKPLGNLSVDKVDYDDLLETHGVAFERDPATFDGIWHNSDDSRLWLYNDASKSRIDYFERLGRLMERSVRIVGKHGHYQ